MSTLLVSICCLTYNHARYIRDALDGFLMQETDFSIGIIIYGIINIVNSLFEFAGLNVTEEKTYLFF